VSRFGSDRRKMLRPVLPVEMHPTLRFPASAVMLSYTLCATEKTSGQVPCECCQYA
jgi:hypothetical protein